MTNTLPERRALTSLTRRCTLVSCCLFLASSVAYGDTLRTDLYQFTSIGLGVAGVDRGAPGLPVYMRVSRGDRSAVKQLGAASPSEQEDGKADVALFEFFVGDESQDISLRKIRFRYHGGRFADAWGKLRRNRDADDNPGVSSYLTLWSSSATTVDPQRLAQWNDAPSLLTSSSADADVTIDLAGPGQDHGLRCTKVLGLVSTPGPSEAIDTVINRQLARGELTVEVQIEHRGGTRMWTMLELQRSPDTSQSPTPGSNILLTSGAISASSVPGSCQSAFHVWCSLNLDPSNEAATNSSSHRVRTPAVRDSLARAPPIS